MRESDIQTSDTGRGAGVMLLNLVGKSRFSFVISSHSFLPSASHPFHFNQFPQTLNFHPLEYRTFNISLHQATPRLLRQPRLQTVSSALPRPLQHIGPLLHPPPRPSHHEYHHPHSENSLLLPHQRRSVYLSPQLKCDWFQTSTIQSNDLI